MAFPDWLPREYPDVFDDQQVIDLPLPELYQLSAQIGASDYNPLNLGLDYLIFLKGSMTHEASSGISPTGEFGFALNIVQYTTYGSALIDYLNLLTVMALFDQEACPSVTQFVDESCPSSTVVQEET